MNTREIQTLIFPKKEFTRKQALMWAKQHGFKHYTSRLTEDTIRLRQFPPDQIKRVLGQFRVGPQVKGLYVVKK